MQAGSVNGEYDETAPLFGYKSEAEAVDEMMEDDAVVTDFERAKIFFFFFFFRFKHLLLQIRMRALV